VAQVSLLRRTHWNLQVRGDDVGWRSVGGVESDETDRSRAVVTACREGSGPLLFSGQSSEPALDVFPPACSIDMHAWHRMGQTNYLFFLYQAPEPAERKQRNRIPHRRPGRLHPSIRATSGRWGITVDLEQSSFVSIESTPCPVSNPKPKKTMGLFDRVSIRPKVTAHNPPGPTSRTAARIRDKIDAETNKVATISIHRPPLQLLPSAWVPLHLPEPPGACRLCAQHV